VYPTRIAYREPPAAPGLGCSTGYCLVRVARELSDETAPLRQLAILMIALLTGRILRPARRLTVAGEHVTATGDLTADLGIGDQQHGRGRQPLPAAVRRLQVLPGIPDRPHVHRQPGRTGGSGHGLGLSIVHSIAEAHGAQTEAAPGPDGGLTVTVTGFSGRD